MMQRLIKSIQKSSNVDSKNRQLYARHFSCEWGKIDIDILGFACMRFVSMINSNSHSDPYRVWSFSNKAKLFFKCLRLVSKKKWKRSWRKEKREGKKFGVLGLKSYFFFVYHWISSHWEKLGKVSFDFSQCSNSYLPWSGVRIESSGKDSYQLLEETWFSLVMRLTGHAITKRMWVAFANGFWRF